MQPKLQLKIGMKDVTELLSKATLSNDVNYTGARLRRYREAN